MISAPSQPNGLRRDATKFVVLFGPNDGSRPTINDEVTWLEPLSCRLSAGAARLDALTLRIDFVAALEAGVISVPSDADGNPVLQDLDTAFAGSNNLAEIRATDADGNFTRVLAWGKFAGDALEIDALQKATVACRLDPYLFGLPLEGFPTYSTSTATAAITAVVAGDAGAGSFTVAGDLRTSFRKGMQVSVDGSTGNDGTYAVSSVKVSGGNTVVTVGQPVVDGTADGNLVWFPIQVDDRVVFNPLIDGTIQGNMSSQIFMTSAGVAAPYFIDPESVLSTNAQHVQGANSASKWDLPSAINFLCQWLNPDQDYIQNPTQDLEALFAGFDSSQLRNTSIPLGLFLPEALDLLLKPLGYWWFLTNSTSDDDPDGQSQSTITIFKRGTGTSEVQVFMDRAGDNISLQGTNCHQVKLERSLANTINVIDGCSAIGHFQCTLPLYPAWDPALNSTSFESLAKDQLTPSTHDIGRKWAVGEAGDYTPIGGGSFGASGISITTTDLSSVFGTAACQLKRRVLKHCLSLDGQVGEGHSLGIWVEWWNQDAILPDGTTGGAWEKIAEPHAVLKRECGIWFEGDFPPPLLWGYATSPQQVAGENSQVDFPGLPSAFSSTAFPFGLRVTAVIEADLRTWSRGVRSPQSPNGADVVQTLDLSHKFPWRALALTGNYASQLPGTAEIQDTTSGDAGSCSFEINGDWSKTFLANFKFQVTGANVVEGLSNNALYTTTSSTYSSGSGLTTINVAEAVPVDSIQGYVVWNTDILDPQFPTSGVSLDTYCQTLQAWQDAAQVNASITLDDASHSEYQIGQTISKIAGRNLKLNAKLPSGPGDDPRHPQIVGINYALGPQQHMEILTETFKKEVFPELEDRGEGRKVTARTTVKHTK